MFTVRRFLLSVISLGVFGGCAYITNVEPQETRGGFSVLVSLPGQPTAARAFADIEMFAHRRGFVRQDVQSAPQFDPATHQPLPPAPGRYLRGKIELDVAYRPESLRVTAYLHSFSHELNPKFIDQFFNDFRQEHASAYGDAETIFQTDFSEGSGGVPRSGGGGRRGGGNGAGR